VLDEKIDCSLFYFGIGEVPLGGHNGKGVRVVNRVRKSPTRTMGTDSEASYGNSTVTVQGWLRKGKQVGPRVEVSV